MLFPVPGLSIIAAKAGSGKTSLIKFGIFELARSQGVDYIYVFTSTPTDYEYLPPRYVISGYTTQKLAIIMNNQSNSRDKRLLLVFDDIIGSVDFFRDPLIAKLVTEFRHFNIGVIISTQYIYRISPVVRENAFTAVLFKQITFNAQKACYESYGGDFKKLKDFQEYMNQKLDADFKFILINNKANRFEDRYLIRKVNIESLPRNGRISF